MLEIDAASNRGIDDVRDLIEKIQFSPVVSTAKVYIIDEVHMLTKEAFNALLKTLEEPPAYAYFILATTELNKIPATIQSRCQCFPFRAVPEEAIIRRLQYIADQERIHIDRDALRAIAHHVNGGMRDAISILDQMRSLEKISTDDVEHRIGNSGGEFVEAIFKALAEKDLQGIVNTVKKVEEEGVAIDVFLHKLLEIVRQNLHKAIEKKESTASLQHYLNTLLKAIRNVRIAPVPGLVVESALLSLCSEENVETSAPVTIALPKAEKKKEKVSKEEKEPERETEKVEKTPEESTEETLKDATIEAPDLTLESLQAAWPQIVSETTPASVKMSLKNGQVHALDDTKVSVSFSSAFHKDKVENPDASRTVEEVMKKIFKRSLKLKCMVGEGAVTDSAPKEPSVNLAEAAAEIF